MPNSELLPRLDSAIAAKNLLTHPFYQDWQAGKLTRKALQLYAAQYYRHVEAFPASGKHPPSCVKPLRPRPAAAPVEASRRHRDHLPPPDG